MYTIFWLENLKGIDHLEDLGVDKKITLKWILGNRVGGCGLDSSGSVTGSCEHDNEPPGSIKGGEFLFYLSDCWFLKDSGMGWWPILRQDPGIFCGTE
jgi:hypothetical protein